MYVWSSHIAEYVFFFFFFPCSADHERDWPPCKVVFFGLATNALNVRNNNNNQPGKVANPARGQLNRENNIPLSPCVPENLVSRDGFSRPVPRQPAHLHTQAESGAYTYTGFLSSSAAASIYKCSPIKLEIRLHILSEYIYIWAVYFIRFIYRRLECSVR